MAPPHCTASKFSRQSSGMNDNDSPLQDKLPIAITFF